MSHDDGSPPLHRTRRRGQRDERGASLVEYALLVALIAVVLVGAVTFLGDTTDTSFSTADSSIRAASEAG